MHWQDVSIHATYKCIKKLILNPSCLDFCIYRVDLAPQSLIFRLHVFASHHIQRTSPLGSFRQQKRVCITTKYRVMVVNITGIQLN